MTEHLDNLASAPLRGLDQREREFLAYELTVVGRAARERADVLRSGGHRGVELAVVELTAFADLVLARADGYHPGSAG